MSGPDTPTPVLSGAPARPGEATAEARPHRRGRRVAAWVAIGLALLVVGGLGAAISASNQWSERDALDPASAGATGTRALVEILRDNGVDVVVARDRATATAALAGAGPTRAEAPGDAAAASGEGVGTATLVLPDAPALSDDALAALAARAADVVLVEPRARTLALLLGDARPAGVAPRGAVEPACELADARRAGPIEPGAVYAADGAATDACYPAGAGYGLLVGTPGAGDRRVAAVDGRALFTNERLAENGNAALGVNLLGRHPLVVWYVPGAGDTDLPATNPSLGELTPPWVSPVIVLLLVAGAAAAVWRGRRFGPLVVERLPVTVRAAETTEGRARLYARSRDAVHAADELRIAALRRLARLLGLGPAAAAGDIADAAAARAGWDRGAVRGILMDDLPRGDADLVSLHERLRRLEDAVTAAVRPEPPERNRP